MARAPRIDHPGAWHHVGHRGIDGRPIFIDDVDRQHFCTLLGDLLERFGLEIHAWCLMGNHHHLLVRSAQGLLSRSMQYLNGSYTRRFNWRHERSGELLHGRFHSTRIDTDSYLAAAGRYIHRNPVEAGITVSPEQYRWSSYPGYLNAADADPWLQRHELLGRFGGNRMRHHRFVTSAETCPIARQLDRSHAPAVLCDLPPTIASESSISAPPPCEVELQEPPGPRREIDLCVVDRAVADAFGVEPASLRDGGKGRSNTPRLAAIALAQRLGSSTQSDIATHYGFNAVRAAEAAMRRATSRRHDDTDFAAALDRVEAQLRSDRAE